MTVQRRPTGTAAQPPKPRVSPKQRRVREDREDRETLDKACDALDAGDLGTISHADLKTRLGLT